MTGAYVLLKALKHPDAAAEGDGTGHPDFARLAALVHSGPPAQDGPPKTPGSHRPLPFFERIGRSVVAIGTEGFSAMAFIGQLVIALGRTARHPRRLRLTPLFAVMEQAGLDGIPIVMMMSFFIGAVIALVGVNSLSELGVSVYTVELVDIAILREFGVVIAAILLAGRSASAFAAEIGSMRMNPYTDSLISTSDQTDAQVARAFMKALREDYTVVVVVDGAINLAAPRVGFEGQEVTYSQFAARMAYRMGSSSAFVAPVWREGNHLGFVLEHLPMPEAGESADDYAQRWPDAYFLHLRRFLSGPPECLRMSGGIWRHIR